MSELIKTCDTNIALTIELAHEMIRLAHKGYEAHEDSSCGVLYGILLDSGYRLLELAEKEKHAHINKGWWEQTVNKKEVS